MIIIMLTWWHGRASIAGYLIILLLLGLMLGSTIVKSYAMTCCFVKEINFGHKKIVLEVILGVVRHNIIVYLTKQAKV